MKIKVFRAIFSVLILVIVGLNAHSQGRSGGVATGGRKYDYKGGDFSSQEVRAIVSQLPDILRARGLQYFSEIDINKIDQVSHSEVLVELKSNIIVDKARKDLESYGDEDLRQIHIHVDDSRWMEAEKMTDAKIRKQAIVFHEVLVILKIEKNDDYTISNRLLGVAFLSNSNIGYTKNQIFPRDYKDPQVIFWKEDSNGNITIFHCTDRSQITSCKLLGTRSYSRQELERTLNKFKDYFNKKAIQLKMLDNGAKVFAAVTLTGLILVSPAFGPLILASSTSAPIALSLASFGSLATWSISSSEIEKNEAQKVHTIGAAEQIIENKAGTAVKLDKYYYGKDEFGIYADSLNKFLVNIDDVENSESINKLP